MASIALYDIDFWAQGKSCPNLELMKVYNYHYQKNDIVKMLKPHEDIERFNHIIYFKENPKTSIPKYLNLSGPKKQIYGYGFYYKYAPLKACYQNIPPSYFPYDVFPEKFNLKEYEKMKNNSYIRVENMDFTNFKEENKHIYIADYDFLSLTAAEDFLKEYKQYTYHFVRPLIAHNEKEFEKIRPFNKIIKDRRVIIDFNFNAIFFKENIKENILYNWEKKENEKLNFYLKRIILMFLYYKNKNLPPQLYQAHCTGLEKKIIDWGKNKNQLPYNSYYKNDKLAQQLMEQADSVIRCLLKTNPLKIESSLIDF